ncbi:hypothetical protein V8E54_003905 [Elaphomyces granulatus]
MKICAESEDADGLSSGLADAQLQPSDWQQDAQWQPTLPWPPADLEDDDTYCPTRIKIIPVFLAYEDLRILPLRAHISVEEQMYQEVVVKALVKAVNVAIHAWIDCTKYGRQLTTSREGHSIPESPPRGKNS